ncbi:divergent polysaccharide deacetylase [Roseovarius sp. A-2]|uniref:divergent polysaccharide deacteylase family protein n=1 Tax=Roseovarius sp. A-2 TaxID=1570360 RepID=UPI0009B53C83|nr:divergent polysaccharide deacteylase family protein [Roseovarius sp. A-2]GAW33447.1 divergent polysaccharide deacetylase [Roseovarius sp. A-2]
MITGTVVSVLALGTVSVLTEVPGVGAPEAETVEVTPGSGFDLKREDRQAALPEVEKSPEAAGAPQVVPPAPDDLSSLSGADTAPVRAPATGGDVDALGTPPEASGGGVAVGSESPVLPSPQSLAPEAPQDEGQVAISTDPAQPPAPDPGETGAGIDASTEDAGARSAVPGLPQEDEAPSLNPEVTPEVSGPADSVTPVAPDEGPVPEAEQTVDDTPEPPKTLPPTGTIGDRVDGVRTNRLPSIGDEPQTDETAAEPEDSPAAAARAIVHNAAAFENPDGKPLMAIVLMDDGSSPIGIEAIGSFPYPLSFAVDADWPGAAEAAARYRDAGFEVLLTVDLPGTASASDTEVAMQSWLDRVPQAVALLEGDGTGVQASREASAQLAPILMESGHGIVMHPNGLDMERKLIAREGVPSATLFRDIDGQGQNPAAIRRFLDQAAMKADQQEEGVIMLGRLRADTISALLLWGLQDRAASVALAPVSAVLLAE